MANEQLERYYLVFLLVLSILNLFVCFLFSCYGSSDNYCLIEFRRQFRLVTFCNFLHTYVYVCKPTLYVRRRKQ